MLVIPSLPFHMSRFVTKPTKWHVHPAKTQISLDIRWSESSLSLQTFCWFCQEVAHIYIGYNFYNGSYKVQYCVFMTAKQFYVPWYELLHYKTNKMTCAPSEDSDQPEHLFFILSSIVITSLEKVGVRCCAGCLLVCPCFVVSYQPRHEKTCLCHMRTTKMQISLHICAVSSASLLFTA